MRLGIPLHWLHTPYGKAFRGALQGLLLGVLLLLPLASQAQSSPIIQAVEVTAELERNGSVVVSQVVTGFGATTLSWPIYGEWRALEVTADNRPVPERQVSVKRQKEGSLITVTAVSAERWQLHYQATSPLIRLKERDQLYLQLLREAGITVERLTVTFRLPAEASGEGLIGNVYAIGGVAGSDTKTIDSRTIRFQAQFLGPKAIFTANAHWPKSVLRLSPSQEFRLALEDLELIPWIGLGILLPLFSFIVLLRLLYRQRSQEPVVTTKLTAPPGSLSPLIVGTLVEKKVYPKEIVAMLIDLCQRGYIVIVKKTGQYYLSPRKVFDSHLEAWERDILESLFPAANTHLTQQEMKALNRKSLFNPKVRRAFGLVYEAVTAKGFFAENPHQTRVRYKLFALSCYFLSVVGAVWIAVTGASPYLLLPCAGTLLVCRLIIKYTPGLVRYTKQGQEARTAWLAFGNFLAEQSPLPLEASRNQIFEKYLSYAIALNATKEWAKRFDLSNTVIVKPDWFISYEETSTAQFAEEIEQFSRSISTTLTEMRGPLVN